MKQYQINFVDCTVETVRADHEPLPSNPVSAWWKVTLMTLDAETHTKFVSFGTVYINMNNVTFIKET